MHGPPLTVMPSALSTRLMVSGPGRMMVMSASDVTFADGTRSAVSLQGFPIVSEKFFTLDDVSYSGL